MFAGGKRLIFYFKRSVSTNIGPCVRTPVFLENEKEMVGLVERLKGRVATVLDGDAAAKKRHEAKKKLLVRERIDKLIDPGSGFLELSQLAAFEVSKLLT